MRLTVAKLLFLFCCLAMAGQTFAEGPEALPHQPESALEAGAKVLPRPESDGAVLAEIGNNAITLGDLLAFASEDPFLVQYVGSPAGRARILNELIEERLLVMAAKDRANLTEDASGAEVRDATRKLASKHLAPDEVTETQVAEYYELHKSTLGIPASVRVRDIVVPIDEGADSKARAQAKAKAEALLTQAKSGASFAELAAQYADSEALRLVEGDRGYLPLHQFPHLREAVAGMEVGEFSDVVELPTGFQVFELLGRREGVGISLAEAEAEIRARLAAASSSAKREALVKSQAKKVGVKVLDSELRSAWPVDGHASEAQ